MFVNSHVGIYYSRVKLQVFNTGLLLTFVIDVFMFCLEIMTPICYYFLKFMLIRISILIGCFNTFERSS